MDQIQYGGEGRRELKKMRDSAELPIGASKETKNLLGES